MTQATMLSFARSHGFVAYAKGMTIVVVIPFIMRDGSEGADKHEAKTWKELRAILGY